MRIRLFNDKSGEPRIYSYTIDRNRPQRDESRRKGLNGAWHLHWPGNSFHVEWVLSRTSHVGLGIEFDSGSDDQVTWQIGVPFVGCLFFGVARATRLLRLLRLDWPRVRSKPSRDWSRSLGVSWHHGALWIYPWVNAGEWNRGHRSWFSINPANILFGRQKYSEGPRESHEATLVMPEGEYLLRVELYTASWKRPRWPKVITVHRANVEVLTKGGAPVPGKGENDYDLDDDAIFEMSCPAETVAAAVEQLRASVMRDRERYGGAEWRPEVKRG